MVGEYGPRKMVQIRKSSLAMGSTIYKAVGLESLKKRENLEVASGKREPQEVSADLQQCLTMEL